MIGKQKITVKRNERGAWCVFIDGELISDHSCQAGARNAARDHVRIAAQQRLDARR